MYKACVHMNDNHKCDLLNKDAPPGVSFCCFFCKTYLENPNSPTPESLCEYYEDGDVDISPPDGVFESY